MVSLDNGISSSIINLETELDSESTSIPITMGLFTDDTYLDELTQVPSYNVPEMMHIGIYADDQGQSQSEFNLALKTCWATPS